MRNASFSLVQVKSTIFLYIAVLFSLFLTISGATSAAVIPQVAGGGFHSLALKPEGTVWAWGWNDFGQLGNGTTSNSAVPVQVSNLSDVVLIARGRHYSMALKSDGTVRTWGRNEFGQLGNGTTTNSNVPVPVSNLSGVIAIDGGGYHCLALKSDGTIWAWGRNDFGQLGNGTTVNSAVPVQVSNLSGVVAIAGGGLHSLAQKSDGTIWAWGRNDSGQLGNGTTVNSAVPVQVSNLSGVIAIAGGGFHNLVLMSDGTVRAWGRNNFGQLGNGTTTNSLVPVQVSNLTDVVSIDRGRSHSLAMRSNGTVLAWGNNSNGQLGNGTTNNSTIPLQVSNLSNAATIAGGGHHTLATKTDGTAWAWGKNDFGQLGDGTTNDSTVPVQVSIDLSIVGGNIAGRITDSQTNAGINGATVTLDTGETATTDTVKGVAGVYEIPNVSAGQHEVTASAPNYALSTQTVTVEEGNPDKTGKNVFIFELASVPGTPTPTPTPGTGNIAGRVTDAQTDAGINGATVMLDTGETATTDTVQGVAGVYEIPNVSAGQHEITASAPNYASSSQTVTVEEGNPDKTGKNVFNFVLVSTATPTPTPVPGTTGNIAGQIKDGATNNPIAGAKVVVAGTGKEATTLANGRYQITGVPIGQQFIEASKEGYETASQTVTVEEGNPDPQTGKNIFNFQLTPAVATPTPTVSPTPAPSPTPSLCEPDSLVALPQTMDLITGEAREETITVVCEDGSPVAGETITWKIKSGKKRITITPESAVTDANGEAKFTITATEDAGSATIKFKDKSADLKATVSVEVIE
ncbi:MAG: carboxypeptidase regulatory-like domain-containing protein [Candidatus Brocadia sp.]|nr:carboxypeptidase regulatory-like domain-containing protein [Candidatus Brocadia sp.]